MNNSLYGMYVMTQHGGKVARRKHQGLKSSQLVRLGTQVRESSIRCFVSSEPTKRAFSDRIRARRALHLRRITAARRARAFPSVHLALRLHPGLNLQQCGPAHRRNSNGSSPSQPSLPRSLPDMAAVRGQRLDFLSRWLDAQPDFDLSGWLDNHSSSDTSRYLAVP